jgi:membrane-associated protein
MLPDLNANVLSVYSNTIAGNYDCTSMFPGLPDFFIQIDKALPLMTETYGPWVYCIFFIVILFETGVIITPFLPGDSLLFVAGMVASFGSLDILWLVLTFLVAGIAGDTLNYWIGNHIGLRVVQQRFPTIVRKKYISRTYGFFERYGGKTIFFARFIPLLRTFAPFLAGVVSMDYRRFVFFNVAGAIVWSVVLTMAGYYLGSVPFIHDNLSLFITLFVILTVISIIVFAAGLIKAVRDGSLE